MKAILVLYDSLNRHALPPYGNDRTHAPNFTRLAQRSVTFTNATIGSMPCIPARRELHTGRHNFLHRSWGPLEPFDDSMPALLDAAGVHTHLVTDHQHYFEDGGATYHTRYTTWQFIRGQEGDPCHAVVDPPPPPLQHRPNAAHHPRQWTQDHINRARMPTPDDQPQAKVFDAALEFLHTNAHADRWFLQIETFDPHEPFFTHERYKRLYPHEYDGPEFDWPPYGPVEEPAAWVEHIRLEYAALVSMCDAHLGRLLDTMDELDLWQDTMLIVTTDHGFLLGEHGWWAKNTMPWYDELARTPFFLWDPCAQTRGVTRDGLAQLIDVPATLLEFFDVPAPPDMHGRSLAAHAAGGPAVRDAAIFGIHGGHVNVTDGRHVYMRACAHPGNTPLYEYTLMPTHLRGHFTPDELRSATLAPSFPFTKGCPVLRVTAIPWTNPYPHGTLLYDRQQDPLQECPVDDPSLEARMQERLVRLMIDNDAPAEQYERLGLGALHERLQNARQDEAIPPTSRSETSLEPDPNP